MIFLNPFLDSLYNFGFKNIGLTPGIPKECFQHPQDVVAEVLLSNLYTVPEFQNVFLATNGINIFNLATPMFSISIA